MFELYRDGLIDLFSKGNLADGEKLKIKKDANGIVYVENSVVEKSTSANICYSCYQVVLLNAMLLLLK